MGDLSEFLPQQSETVARIYAAWKARGDAEPQRGYLGASILGHECDRYLWYVFRGAVREDVPGRIYRLFDTGDKEELRLAEDLRAIGCQVWTTDESGEQFAISALGGHFSGHLDGVVLGVPEAPKTPHVGEFKTHKESSFRKLEKEGVRGSKPMHFAQMQLYMGHMKLDRALYLARNKDTDELYSERVKFDLQAFDRLMARARRVIESPQPLERCATRVDDWRCKFCPAQRLCWGSDESAPAVPIPAVTCKTCVHATAETGKPGATWSCARYGCEVDPAVGAECPTHLLLPGLVSFAEPVDADEDMIEFQNLDGARWQHGNAAGQWSARALLAGRGPLEPGGASGLPIAGSPDPTAGSPGAQPVAHPGGIFGQDPDGLLARYPWQDSERLWDGPEGQLLEAGTKLLGGFSTLGPPVATQDDELVNAAEWHLGPDSDYLVVRYKLDKHAAIWRGKS